MTVTGFPQLLIDAPPFRPSAYGLLQVAAVSDNTALRALAGATFPTNATRAMTAIITLPGECDPFTDLILRDMGAPKIGPGNGSTKERNILEDWINAYPIAGYGWWECSTGGYTIAEAQALAQQRYLAAESRTLEGVIWNGILTAGECDDTGTTIIEALAYAEDLMALLYGGEGIIHMSRGTATLLGAANLQRVGSTLRTICYTPVVIGDGYDDLNVIAISGPISVVRGPLDSLTPNPGAAIDRARNNLTGIVERAYLVAIDDPVHCFSLPAAPI